MKIFRFDKEAGKHITKFDSDLVLTRITTSNHSAHVSCMHVGESGRIGFHQAVVNQLLLIVSGKADVCGEDKVFSGVKTGEAVFWKKENGMNGIG